MRNHSIDILRLVCAFLVILLHVGTAYYSYTEPIARSAVPLFFMLSGYFYSGGVKKNLRKTSWILVAGSLLYATVNYILDIEEVDNFPLLKSIVAFVLFNNNPFAYHLWYLAAYIYVLAGMIFIERYSLLRISYWAIPLLLVMGILLGKYSESVLDNTYYSFLSRNFLFLGIPFFLTGHYIKQHKEKLLQQSSKIYLGGVALFASLSYAESGWLGGAEGDLYISTVFLSICALLFTLSCHVKQEGIMSRIGRKYSLHIYILHLFNIKLLSIFVSRMPDAWQVFYTFASPVVILLATWCLIQLLRTFKLIKG